MPSSLIDHAGPGGAASKEPAAGRRPGGKAVPAAIFIAVPVYLGWEFVRETLECIRGQSFGNYRALISVDGADERSAAECAPYTSDPRFELAIQPAWLGWKRNLNWLIERSSGRYFCYWQQDDLADRNYLQALHDWAEQHPAACCTYADVQWFGTRTGRARHESVLGNVRDRVRHAFKGYHWIALRGLVQHHALSRIGLFSDTTFNVDFAWAVKLAAVGELHRVADTLYYKRAHPASASARGALVVVDQSHWQILIAFALELLGTVEPLLTASHGRLHAIGYVVARLLAPSGAMTPLFRVSGFSENARRRFLLELFDRHAPQYAPLGIAAPTGSPPEAPAETYSTVDDDVRTVARWLSARSMALDDSRAPDRVDLDLGAASGNGWLLREGWSNPEDSGVWSVGEASRIVVPIPAHMGKMKVMLVLSAYLAANQVERQVLVHVGDSAPRELRFKSRATRRFCADLSRDAHFNRSFLEIKFSTPGSVSPMESDGKEDARRLGIWLACVRVQRLP